MKNYKIIFIDLDGTLIKGDIFPKNIWDIKINYDLLSKLKEMSPLAIFVKGENKWDFEFKMEYLIKFMEEYTGSFVEYFYDIESIWDKIRNKWFEKEDIKHEDCLMIGEVFSKECSENFGYEQYT